MPKPKIYSGLLKVTEAFGTKTEPHAQKYRGGEHLMGCHGCSDEHCCKTVPWGQGLFFVVFARSSRGLLCFLQALRLPPTDQRLYLGMSEMTTLICLKVWMKVWMDIWLCMLALQWASALSRLKPHLFPEDSWDGIEPLPHKGKMWRYNEQWCYVGNVSGSLL